MTIWEHKSKGKDKIKKQIEKDLNKRVATYAKIHLYAKC